MYVGMQWFIKMLINRLHMKAEVMADPHVSLYSVFITNMVFLLEAEE